MYLPTSPSDASRIAFFAAAACPFFRRTAMAFSMSPPASTSAARQSAKPALVRSRNSLTSWAGICTAGCCVLILFSLCCLAISLLVLLVAKRARTESLGAGLTTFHPRNLFSVYRRPKEHWLPHPRPPPLWFPPPPRRT